ncbi:MAG: hypothetical protein CVU99_12965 [Firmicutes bacterium HGW-Firmicutes-4]|nr:MAG: hypothetical protein CVU99_12965 [Firmicutes bacterium HGW-Firmicutes-4]
MAFKLFPRETGNDGLDDLRSCFLGKQNDQETEDIMEQNQEPSSRFMGMRCDFQRLSEFLKDKKIIFIDPKSEHHAIMEKEASVWK